MSYPYHRFPHGLTLRSSGRCAMKPRSAAYLHVRALLMQPYAVALVLDPEFGKAMEPLAKSLHVWAVGSPTNRAIANELWKRGPQPYEYNNESGITPFDFEPGSDRESWCRKILDTIDQHHDEWSHDPPYTVLLVYGLRIAESLKPSFAELGFTRFEETDYGFRAIKTQP